MCVTKNGYLFVATEFGNQLFYRFLSIGADEENPIFADSSMDSKEKSLVRFFPRKLKNLAEVD